MVENKLWLAITCLPVNFIFSVQYTYWYTCLGLYEKISHRKWWNVPVHFCPNQMYYWTVQKSQHNEQYLK